MALYHLPWSEVLTVAVMPKEYRGVADTDQAGILGELIRYLEHPRSGVLEFSDMGSPWVGVREAVPAGTLHASNPGASAVAGRFDALVRFDGLKLGRQLGTEFLPTLTRKEVAPPTCGRPGSLATSTWTRRRRAGDHAGQLARPAAQGRPPSHCGSNR
ncbi:hypothetical protein [Actinoplanes sp. URMC 104]|uniref:hypothetical protein n=1 Tax=Actinoplanes sp. URMC 104 TaxID=3423409 RepID=UPI003F1E32FC